MAYTSQCGHEPECTTNEIHRDLLTQEREVTHALAVAMAKVLEESSEEMTVRDVLRIATACGLIGEADDTQLTYATPQIAATVAALAQEEIG